jgi:hypothetical protein
MLLLLFAKIAATSITLGSGGSGGVFAPSLFLGAMLGGSFGTIAHGLFPAATGSSGAYALVGMGAVVAAATHAPITAILLIFEMTQSVAIIAPLMVACVIATLAAMFLRRESIYTLSLVHKGLDVYTGKDPNVLRSLSAHDFVDRAPAVIRSDADFGVVVGQLLDGTHDELFVVDEEGRLEGAISLDPLRRDLAGGIGTRVSLASRGREVDLGDGYALAEFEAPQRFHDRSLRELDLAGRFGIQVLLLRSRTPLGETVRVPKADDRIGPGDRIVAAGSSAALARLDAIG